MKEKYLRILSLFLLACLLFLLFGIFGLGSAANEAWMDAHVRAKGAYGIFVYIGLVSILTACGIPRQLCSFLGGYVFGMWFGTLWATIGTAIACSLCFSYARFLGQKWMHQRFGHKTQALNDFLCQSPFMLTLVVRIVPLGSNFLTNFLAGMSRIPALSFLGGSFVGFTIQNFIFATLGSGLQVQSTQKTLISGMLYAISLSLGYWVYKQYKASRK